VELHYGDVHNVTVQEDISRNMVLNCVDNVSVKLLQSWGSKNITKMQNDPLAAMLSKLLNAERLARKECTIKVSSSTIKRVLEIMNEHHYVGGFDLEENQLTIHLLGKINKCGVIKPRFSTKADGFEKWEKRYLPAKDFGIIIVSTPKGIMTHQQAKEQHTGGTLLAYCY